MSTLREIISSIREILNAYSDDSTLSDEHLAFLIKNKRATYLEVLANNPRKQMPREAYQKIKLILEASPDCEDGITILESESYLPEVINNDQDIEGMNKVYLPSIMAKWINIVNFERIPFLRSGGRFNNKQIYISKDSNDKLIVLSPSELHVFLEQVEIEIIATDPEEADALLSSDTSDEVCDFYDKKYPLPESLIKAVTIEIANELIASKQRMNQDVANNGSDDTLNQKIPYYGPRRQQQQEQSTED